MRYEMKLWPDSFNAIKEKLKTIEMRLNDEKRAVIKMGDTIEFTNSSTNEKIICEVINRYEYATFEDLYSHHDKISIEYKENEKADPKDMFNYYSLESITKYGVLALEIKVLP